MKDKKILYISLAAAAALRLAAGLTVQLWYDEAFTKIISMLPFGQMIQATAGDTHPPAYYALTWLVCQYNCSEVSLRIPSLLFSLLAIYLAWLLLNRINWPGINWVLLLMVIAPTQIHYAVEARMYSLLLCLVLLALILLVDRRWIWLTVVLTAMLYTHNYGLFYVGAIWLVSIAMDPKSWHRITISCMWAGLAFIPWGLVLLGQMAIIEGNYWIQPVTPGTVVYALFMQLYGFNVPELFQVPAIMVISGLIIWGAYRVIRHNPPNTAMVFIMAFVPMGLALLGSILWQPVFLFRGFIGSTVFIYAIIAYAYQRVGKVYKIYAAAIVIPVLVAAISGYYVWGPSNKYINNPTGKKTDMDRIMEVIGNDKKTVIHITDGTIVGWTAYKPSGWTAYKLEIPGCLSPAGALSKKTRDQIITSITPDQLPGEYWLFYAHGPTNHPCEREYMQLIPRTFHPWPGINKTPRPTIQPLYSCLLDLQIEEE